jgi:hypothetical protein
MTMKFLLVAISSLLLLNTNAQDHIYVKNTGKRSSSSAAIDSAIKTAIARHMRKVILDTGVFYIDRTINIPSNLEFSGSSPDPAKDPSTIIKQLSPKRFPLLVSKGTENPIISNLILDFENGILEGCLSLLSVKKGKVTHVWAKNGYNYDIWVGKLPNDAVASDSCVILNCKASGERNWPGAAKAQIIAGDHSTHTVIKDCTSYGFKAKGDLYGADNSPNTLFENCTADGTDGGNAGIWLEAVGFNRNKVINVSIEGCTIRNTNVGIGVTQYSKGSVSNTKIYNCRDRGIWFRSVNPSAAVHCYLYNCGSFKQTYSTAVHFETSNNSIESSDFENNPNGDISIYTGAADRMVSGTKILNNTLTKGIKFIGSDKFANYTNIAHNNFKGCPRPLIQNRTILFKD